MNVSAVFGGRAIHILVFLYVCMFVSVWGILPRKLVNAHPPRTLLPRFPSLGIVVLDYLNLTLPSFYALLLVLIDVLFTNIEGLDNHLRLITLTPCSHARSKKVPGDSRTLLIGADSWPRNSVDRCVSAVQQG